jgi:signal transduction histidine kinase
MMTQEQELAEKRLADERGRVAGEFRQELLSRLERIKLEAVSARTTEASAPRRADGEQAQVLALVGTLENDRLVLPWDRQAVSQAAAAALDEPRFASAIRLGEHDELVVKQFDRAAAAYRRALAGAHLPQQTALARLLTARALTKGGRTRDAAALNRELLDVPASVVDEQGVPFALYAARRLLDADDASASDHLRIPDVLNAGLTVDPPLPPVALYMLGDLAAKLAASASDAALRQAATAVLRAATDRGRDIEQALALQHAFPTLVPRPAAPSPTGADSVWVPFGPAEERWLVGLTSSRAGAAPLVLAVRASLLFAAIQVAADNSGSVGRANVLEVRSDSNGEPLGGNFPGLSLTFPASNAATVAREWSLQRSFYLGALLLVLTVALFGGYLFWRDVQRELRLAEVRSQFVSSVSHELKTPLTAIRMFAETLLMGRSARPEVRDEYLETIVNESERLTRLLNNVLDFSKIEGGSKTYRLEPQPLPGIVRAAAKAMQYPFSQQGFELRVAIDDGLPLVPAEADALQQAILNLLSNALKYSGQGRVIDLQLKKEAGHAVVSVTDRGPGIPPSEHVKIFDKFYRVPSVDTERIPGTGLGLTLVDHVARAHGGRVMVTSATGEGSTFSILLPLPPAATEMNPMKALA